MQLQSSWARAEKRCASSSSLARPETSSRVSRHRFGFLLGVPTRSSVAARFIQMVARVKGTGRGVHAHARSLLLDRMAPRRCYTHCAAPI